MFRQMHTNPYAKDEMSLRPFVFLYRGNANFHGALDKKNLSSSNDRWFLFLSVIP